MAIEKATLSKIADLVGRRLGLRFPEDRWSDLERGLVEISKELGLDGPQACARRLLAMPLSSKQIELLASRLTIGETYFLREPAMFKALERRLLPGINRLSKGRKRNLRVWSAGCSTGEEPYSLAIALERAVTGGIIDDYSILATDINVDSLSRAEIGCYGSWSFRSTPDGFQDEYFSKTGKDTYIIDPMLKEKIHFQYLNLAEDPYPSIVNQTQAMDIIFCRNVLMYFATDLQMRVIDGFHRCLMDGGWLCVSPCEASPRLYPAFSLVQHGGALVFMKGGDAGQVTFETTVEIPESGFTASQSAIESFAVEPVASEPIQFAEPALEECIVPPPIDQSDTPLELARISADNGDLKQALAWCMKAMTDEPDNLDARFLCAAVCQETGDLDRAVSALGQVLYLDQDYVMAHYILGLIHERLGRARESRRHVGIASSLLDGRGDDEVVPGSDGMSCRQLKAHLAVMGRSVA